MRSYCAVYSAVIKRSGCSALVIGTRFSVKTAIDLQEAYCGLAWVPGQAGLIAIVATLGTPAVSVSLHPQRHRGKRRLPSPIIQFITTFMAFFHRLCLKWFSCQCGKMTCLVESTVKCQVETVVSDRFAMKNGIRQGSVPSVYLISED